MICVRVGFSPARALLGLAVITSVGDEVQKINHDLSWQRAVTCYAVGVNILIENNETLEYLTQSGSWTKNPLSGQSFPNRQAAFQTAKLETTGKFNIVGHIAKTNQFVNLDHGQGGALSAASAE